MKCRKRGRNSKSMTEKARSAAESAARHIVQNEDEKNNDNMTKRGQHCIKCNTTTKKKKTTMEKNCILKSSNREMIEENDVVEVYKKIC